MTKTVYYTGKNKSSEAGIGYMAILVLLAILSALAFSFLLKVGTQTSAVMARGDGIRARYLAESGANHAMWRLLNETVSSVKIRISHDDDDANEKDDGTMGLWTHLKVGREKCGMRFLNVSIPQGATITNAYLRLKAEASHSIQTDGIIFGEDTDDATRFTATNGDISNRSQTVAGVAWNNILPWKKDDFYQTPNLTSIIQEIVDRPGWSSGNSIAILTNPGGTRSAISHDISPADAPLLYIEYGDASAAVSSRYYMHSMAGGRYGYKIQRHTDTTFATIAAVGAVGENVVQQSYVLYVIPDNSTHPCLTGWWKLDDTSGLTAADGSVYGNDGVLTNMSGNEWTTGIQDGALEFDGSNDYVNIGAAGDKIQTVAFWMKAHYTPPLLFEEVISLAGNKFIEVNAGNITAYGFPGTTIIYVDGKAGTAVTTAWHHVAITDTTGINVSALNLGRVFSQYFDGVLDDVRIYNCALSAEEIEALYCAGGAKYREFTEAKTGSDVTSIIILTPGGTGKGDLLIAAVATDGDTSASMSPPSGEGWTEIDINDYSGEVTLGAWWKLADASESPKHQFAWSGAEQAYGWMMRFTCHDPSDPIRVLATGGETGINPTGPSVTTTVDDALILRLGAFDDNEITVDNPGLSGHTAITMDSNSTGRVSFKAFTEAKMRLNGQGFYINTPAGTGEGDLLIAAITTDGNTSGTMSPPGGVGWTAIDLNDHIDQVTLGVWWKLAGASETSGHYYNFTWGSKQKAYGWIMRFIGHDPTSPINAFAAGGGGYSQSPSSPSVTTTVANTMIVRIGGFDDDDITVDNPGLAGHTAITMDGNSLGGSNSGGAGYRQQAAIGSSGTSDFSLKGIEEYRAVTIAITPSSDVGTVSGGAGYVAQPESGTSTTTTFTLNQVEESRTITIAISPAGN